MLTGINEICKNFADDYGIVPTKQDIEFCGLMKLRKVIHPQGEQPDLICIGARAGMGKTSLALDIALDAAIHSDKEVLIFSMELSPEFVAMQMIQKLCGVNIHQLNDQTLCETDKSKASAAIAFLQELKIWIDDCREIAPSYIEQCVKERKNIGLIIIDYVQLISPVMRSRSRQKEEFETAEKLSMIAKKHNAKMLIFTQLSRSACARNRPMIDDIYYSDNLTEKSDIILLIYRNAYYNSNSPDNSAEIIVAKNNFGKCGVINMRFDRETVSFKE